MLRGHRREETARFVAFRSHWRFESEFCTPAEGHEKGGVEGEANLAGLEEGLAEVTLPPEEEGEAVVAPEGKQDDGPSLGVEDGRPEGPAPEARGNSRELPEEEAAAGTQVLPADIRTGQGRGQEDAVSVQEDAPADSGRPFQEASEGGLEVHQASTAAGRAEGSWARATETSLETPGSSMVTP